MKTAFEQYNQIVASIPEEIHKEVEMQIAVSNRIFDLMTQKGLSKKIGRASCRERV